MTDRHTLRLARNTEAPQRARRLIRAALRDCPPSIVRSVELATSELVTNAVVHTDDDEIEVVISTDGPIRIEVWDNNPALPRPLRPSTFRPRGRGLAIVELLADRWGVTPKQEDASGTRDVSLGKGVWFELNP